MSKAKDERTDLLNLLGSAVGSGDVEQNSASVKNAEELPDKVESEPLFTIDKEGELKKIKKQCRNSVKEIAKAVLPENVLQTSAMQDKIENDAMSMVSLFWQLKINSIMQDAITDQVSKGNITPRMIEVFNQLTEKISAIEKQKITTLKEMRKSYIDYKTDMLEKEMEERSAAKQLENQSQNQSAFGGGGRIMVGSKSFISSIRNKMIEDAKFEEMKDGEKQ